MRYFFFLLLIPLLLIGCSEKRHVLRVAATPVPHAEILEAVKPELKKEGIVLEIVEVDDYNLPNRLLYEGRVDANFFQHEPFLKLQNMEFGYDLVAMKRIHLEPLGIYSKKIDSLSNLPKKAIIALPSDPTNESRALLLLADQGLITLKPSPLATPLDIIDNPKELRFKEIDAALLPRILSDVDAAAIPANFAFQGGYSLKEALALEPPTSEYANVLVVRRGEENRTDLQALAEALTSKKVKEMLSRKGLQASAN